MNRNNSINEGDIIMLISSILLMY